MVHLNVTQLQHYKKNQVRAEYSLQGLNLNKALLEVAFAGLLGCSCIRHFGESFLFAHLIE